MSLWTPPAGSGSAALNLLYPPHDEDVELAEQCAASLSTFVRQAWPIVEPATPFVSGWHIDVVCEHLEAVTAGQLPRLIINIPPRAMKSLTVGVFWPAWEWLRSPHVRWLFATYAQDLSLRDSAKCRRVIQSQGGADSGNLFRRRGYQGVLKLLGQSWSLMGDQNAKEKYETTEMGFRLATSVGGVATGEGGDRVVIDDPVSAKQARSDAVRKDANLWWDETMSTRFNNARATAVIVMQRLHQQDLTGHLVEKGGWHHLVLPAEYEPSHPFVYPDKVLTEEQSYPVQAEDGSVDHVTIDGGLQLPGDPRTEPGQLLEPVRLGTDKLTDLRRSLGSYGYAGQMQQRPSPSEGGMFNRGWWQEWKPDLETYLYLGWDQVVTSWDMRFSDSQAETSSYVVGQVWGVHGADRYLLGQIRARLSFTDTLKAVQSLAAWRKDSHAKLVEKKANGAAVINTLQRKVTGLIPIEPEGGKDVRAAAVSPLVEAGNVFLPSTDFIPCPKGYEPTSVADFIEEFALFPNGSNDDQVDAMSQALNWIGPGSVGGAIVLPAEASSDDGEPDRRSTDHIMNEPM